MVIPHHGHDGQNSNIRAAGIYFQNAAEFSYFGMAVQNYIHKEFNSRLSSILQSVDYLQAMQTSVKTLHQNKFITFETKCAGRQAGLKTCFHFRRSIHKNTNI
jgi:hypothetical protein